MARIIGMDSLAYAQVLENRWIKEVFGDLSNSSNSTTVSNYSNDEDCSDYDFDEDEYEEDDYNEELIKSEIELNKAKAEFFRKLTSCIGD